MKFLLVSVTPLWHRRFGKAIVMTGLLDYLRSALPEGHLGVVTLSLDDELHENLPELVAQVPKPSAFNRLVAMIVTLLVGRRSLQEAVYSHESTARGLDEAIRRFEPDVILCDTLRSGQFFLDGRVSAGRARLMIYLDDLYSERYDAILRALRRHPSLKVSAIGNFGRMLPGPVARLLEFPALQSWMLRVERDRLRVRERRAPEMFERCLLINPDEAQLLRQRTGRQNVSPLKPLLGRTFEYARAFDGRSEFIFLGDLSVPHNEVSTFEFLSRMLPELRTVMPDIHLRIIGPGSSERLEHLARNSEGHVSVEGFVLDLDEVLLGCTALVAPLLFGSGLKLKLLEALGRGVPVVATDFAVEGIGRLRHGENVMVSNDLAAFPALMHELTNQEVNSRLSRASARLFQEEYADDVVRSDYAAVLLGRD